MPVDRTSLCSGIFCAVWGINLGKVDDLSLPFTAATPMASVEPSQIPSISLGEGSGLPDARHGESSSWGSGRGWGSSMGVDEDLGGVTSMLLGDLEIGVELAVASPSQTVSLLAG